MLLAVCVYDAYVCVCLYVIYMSVYVCMCVCDIMSVCVCDTYVCVCVYVMHKLNSLSKVCHYNVFVLLISWWVCPRHCPS